MYLINCLMSTLDTLKLQRKVHKSAQRIVRGENQLNLRKLNTNGCSTWNESYTWYSLNKWILSRMEIPVYVSLDTHTTIFSSRHVCHCIHDMGKFCIRGTENCWAVGSFGTTQIDYYHSGHEQRKFIHKVEEKLYSRLTEAMKQGNRIKIVFTNMFLANIPGWYRVFATFQNWPVWFRSFALTVVHSRSVRIR